MADIRDVVIRFESNIAEFNKQLTKLDKNTEAYDKTLEQLEDTQDEYDKTLIENGKNMQIFGTSINGITGAFKGMQAAIRLSIRSLGALKVALAATGIGLILIAWQAFNLALSSSKRLQDELAITTAGLSNVYDAFTGKVATAVENLLGLNDELDKNEKGITKVNKVIAFFLLGMEKAGLAARGTAGTFAGLVKQGEDLERTNIELRDSQNQFNLETAQARLEIELLIQSTRELTSSELQNLIAIRQGIKQFDQLQVVQLARLKIQEDLLIGNVAAAGNSVIRFKAEQDLLLLQQTILQFEIRSSAQRRELLLREVEAFRRLEVSRKKAGVVSTKEDLDEFVEIKIGELDIIESVNASILESDLKLAKDQRTIKELQRLQAAADLAAEEADDDKKLASASRLAGGIASLFGQQSVAGKAAAIAQATIDTYAAANAALRSGSLLSPTAGFLAAAAAIAVGLANVQKILSQPLPQVTISATPFARGGMVNGELHTGPHGGVHAIMERGEAVINRKSMGMPGVREAASYLNQLGGGIKFAHGGIVPNLNTDTSQIVEAINIAAMNSRTVLVTEDLDVVQNRVTVTEERATL